MKNILFCGNYKVFDGMLTCMLSIVKRTKSDEPFNFILFTMDVSHLREDYTLIPEKQIRFIENTLKEYNPENKISCYDVTKLYMQEFSGCPNEGAYCSPYTLLRLLADMIDDIPDKLLYLDADIMFNREIELLYDIDVTDYEYAAARDHYGKFLLNPNYINAGVLLLNMKKIRETGLFRKGRELLRERKLLFADQDAIYKSTTAKKMLKQRFNDQKFLHKHTVVRHFSKRLFYLPYPHTDNIKQWHIEKVHKIFKYHQFDDELNEYIELKNKFESEYSYENKENNN